VIKLPRREREQLRDRCIAAPLAEAVDILMLMHARGFRGGWQERSDGQGVELLVSWGDPADDLWWFDPKVAPEQSAA
jgi:hypothetical protein